MIRTIEKFKNSRVGIIQPIAMHLVHGFIHLGPKFLLVLNPNGQRVPTHFKRLSALQLLPTPECRRQAGMLDAIFFEGFAGKEGLYVPEFTAVVLEFVRRSGAKFFVHQRVPDHWGTVPMLLKCEKIRVTPPAGTAVIGKGSGQIEP